MAAKVASDSILKGALVILTGERLARITDGRKMQFIRSIELIAGGVVQEHGSCYAHDIVSVKVDDAWHPVELSRRHEEKARMVTAFFAEMDR